MELHITVMLRGCPWRSPYSQEVSGVDILRERDSSDADVRSSGCKNLRIFLKLWCVRTDKKVEPVWTICGQRGRAVNFSRFLRTSFITATKMY